MLPNYPSVKAAVLGYIVYINSSYAYKRFRRLRMKTNNFQSETELENYKIKLPNVHDKKLDSKRQSLLSIYCLK